MTKLLGLWRHAKSDWDDVTQRDFDRGLNARGRKGARLIGGHIRSHGVKWEVLLASPAVRVKDTLAEAALPVEAVWDENLYLADGTTIIDVVKERAGGARAVLVCGHNPGLQDLLLELVPPAAENDLFDEASVKFPTASFAVLELAIDDWGQLGEECGALVHFARPRDLDPSLGPETVV
ncbi:MAG: SixA phosphatase family protein [Tsuneonella sp.]